MKWSHSKPDNPLIPERSFEMEVLGWIFIAIIALVAAIAVTLGLVSLPDARRYLKLRRM